MSLDVRRLFFVPPANAEEDGELSVLGVQQSRALGDALADIPLRAVYASPGRATEDTAAAIAQRHGLVVRPKPSLDFNPQESFRTEARRIIETFELIARAGPGRTSLIVLSIESARIVLSHCSGIAPSPEDPLIIPSASITEVTVEESRFLVERLGDTDHLDQLKRDRP